MKTDIRRVKACAFCRYWQGTPPVPSSPKNYYEYNLHENAKCMQKQINTSSGSPGCQHYTFDTYKFPIAQ